MSVAKGKLTAKQSAFCEEYLIDLNATQAAIRAGYKPDNAKQIGAENLTKLAISCFITELKAKRSEETKIDAAWVLTEAARCFKINSASYESEAGNRVLVNANAAKGFLELVGKHVNVKAFEDKTNTEEKKTSYTFNIVNPHDKSDD